MSINRENLIRRTVEGVEGWRGQFKYLRRHGTTQLRIFEYPNKEGKILFAYPFVEHYLSNRLPVSSCVCRKDIFGERCLFCVINKLIPVRVKYTPFPVRNSYVINAMDVGEEHKSINLYLIPYSVFMRIAEFALVDGQEDILEYDSCRVFALERTGEGRDTRYKTKLMPEKVQPLPKKYKKQIVRPYRIIKDPGLWAQFSLLREYLDREVEKFSYE
jgi:hypothetical protein